MKLHQEEELKKSTECLGESSEHVTSNILVLSVLILLFLAEINFCADTETFFCHSFAKYYRNQGEMKEKRIFSN